MSDSETLEAEVVRLRAEVEAYRERELDSLRTRAATAEQAAEHYRTEANRNADIGRQIAAEAQQQLADLRGRLDHATLVNGHSIRTNANARGN